MQYHNRLQGLVPHFPLHREQPVSIGQERQPDIPTSHIPSCSQAMDEQNRFIHIHPPNHPALHPFRLKKRTLCVDWFRSQQMDEFNSASLLGLRGVAELPSVTARLRVRELIPATLTWATPLFRFFRAWWKEEREHHIRRTKQPIRIPEKVSSINTTSSTKTTTKTLTATTRHRQKRKEYV